MVYLCWIQISAGIVHFGIGICEVPQFSSKACIPICCMTGPGHSLVVVDNPLQQLTSAEALDRSQGEWHWRRDWCEFMHHPDWLAVVEYMQLVLDIIDSECIAIGSGWCTSMMQG